ncbi:MAG: class I poly(R)-hydroxyalkanoic acid synthase [Proteobacteria bacterium]|nr:class I poly(R)-hydroxyalkanoic acid synthase [Pseudomonadota bacterium]
MKHEKNKDPKETLQPYDQASLDLMGSFLHACQVMTNYNKVTHANWQDIFNLDRIYKVWFSELTRDPAKLWHAQANFFQDYFKLCQQVQTLSTGEKALPLVEPEPHDKRFKAQEWHDKPYFFFLQQCYLLFSQHCKAFMLENKSQNPVIARQVNFFTQQILDALSPTNFIYTNPEVIKHMIATKGESLFLGFKHFLDDVIEGNGHFNVKMTDTSAFEIGKNVAITPGKIIFQNRMFQLIQYAPATEKVFDRPLLIIPPWINKYYILDIREKNSFVKWIVDQGHTVFMISWVNPDSSYYETTFDDYLFEGIFKALEAIEQITNQKEVNALGFCIGGTLLATALAYMKATNDKRIVSSTFLTTLLDFTDPGEIAVFIDEDQLRTIENKMKVDGYLDGRVLMTTFNMLRVNDLFWPYYINNYLCGQTPFAFDLLYWNSDSVNLPQKMLSSYLRNMYLNNLLIQKGGISIKEVKLDLSAIDIPAYFLSTEQDHIAPWASTFMGARVLSSPVTFVLGGSGHIAGVINPPASHKYSYRYLDKNIRDYATAEQWLSDSLPGEGSWWVHWEKWLQQYAGKQINPRIPGEGKLPILQDAPGDYVKKLIR